MTLENIKAYAKDFGVPIIRSESDKILTDLIVKTKPKHILEIGTAIGYSGIIMLKNCSADLVTIEHNKDYIKQANRNFQLNKLSKRVELLNGDCLVELARLVCEKKYLNHFDFVFLDGPKAQYDNMLDLIILLLAPEGTLVVDDVLFHGYIGEDAKSSKRFKTIINRLNNFIENCKNHKMLKNFKLIEIEDGLIVANKETYEK